MLLKYCFLLLLLPTFSAVTVAQQPSPTLPAKPLPAASPQSSDTVSVQSDLQYGMAGGEKLVLDLYLPASDSQSARPAVVLLHGGGWSGGDKQSMHGMANFLARSGYVAISVNYRLLQRDSNRWPAQLDDAQLAVRWLRSNAAKYNVDPNHIGAFGHSAGAQLAALLGMVDTRNNSDAALSKYSSRVQAVVDVDGLIDFVELGNSHGGGELVSLFGAPYEKAPDIWRDASPACHVAKDNAPFLILHGTQDDIVPMAQAQELNDKLQAAGVPVVFIKLEDGHTPTSPEVRRQLAHESLLFFDKYLKANSK